MKDTTFTSDTNTSSGTKIGHKFPWTNKKSHLDKFKQDFKNQLSPEILGLFIEFLDVRVIKFNSSEYENARKDVTGNTLCEILENRLDNIQTTFQHFNHVNHINRFAKLRPLNCWFENWNPNIQQNNTEEHMQEADPALGNATEDSPSRNSTPTIPSQEL